MIAEDHGFNQLVKEPTRIQGNTENILDLVYSNNSSSIYKTSVVEGTVNQSNVLVDVNIKPTLKRKVKRKVFLREKADTASISKALKDLFPVYESDTSDESVEVKWNWFQQKVHNIMDTFVLHKVTSSRYSLPWFSRVLRRQVRKNNVCIISLRRHKVTK